MLNDFFKKGSFSEQYSKFFTIIVFTIFWTTYLLGRIVQFSNYSQIAIDVLMHLAFLGLLYFMLKKHGLWTVVFAIASFLIITYAEVQSVYVLNTYDYLNWPSGILWTYPTTIGIGWVYLCYACYLTTNIVVLGRENVYGFPKGDNYLPNKPLYKRLLLIIALALIDGLFLLLRYI